MRTSNNQTAGAATIPGGMSLLLAALAAAQPAPLAAAQPAASRPVTTRPAAAAPPGEAQTRKALEYRLLEYRFDGTRLDKTLAWLGEASGAAFFLDGERLKAAGISPETQVRLRGNARTVSEVLDDVVKELGGKERVAARPVGHVVVVSTPKGVAAVAKRMEALAVMMDDPAARKILTRELPALQFEKQTLREVVSWVLDAGCGELVVDWTRLEAEAGVTRETVITVHTRPVPLGEALMLILHAAGGKTPLDMTVKKGVVLIAPGNVG